MSDSAQSGNIDAATVQGFGDEWSAFDQTELSEGEHRSLFEGYFSIFPFDVLPPNAEGFDLGCGSGRWAALASERVGTLNCIDPSPAALSVARRRLSNHSNVRFFEASVDAIPLPDASQDFGYSLGVLHHVPDTAAGLRDCARKLRPGAPLLVYLYYRFDNKPAWFRQLWRMSEIGRRAISRMPFRLRKATTNVIAAAVYFPLARGARLAEKAGVKVDNLPLSAYRGSSFYSMRTDALDRFGTRLEQRFTRPEITQMMENAGLENIRFSDGLPYWTAIGWKKK
jgi:ubiquinone/menaquinone biosynthesis C-methylase UbiE